MDQSFFDLSTADLQKATISSEALGRIITTYANRINAQGVAPDQTDEFEISALLAQLVKNNQRAAVSYRVYAFSFPIDARSYVVQQVLPENPDRKFLIMQVSGNVTHYLLFQQQSQSAHFIDISTVNTLAPQGLLVSNPSASDNGILRLEPAPSNPISILLTGLSTSAATVLIIEGV